MFKCVKMILLIVMRLTAVFNLNFFSGNVYFLFFFNVFFYSMYVPEWLVSNGESSEFEMLPPEQMNQMLRRFHGEVRSQKGNAYSKEAYTGLRASINISARHHIVDPSTSSEVWNLRLPTMFSLGNLGCSKSRAKMCRKPISR